MQEKQFIVQRQDITISFSATSIKQYYKVKSYKMRIILLLLLVYHTQALYNHTTNPIQVTVPSRIEQPSQTQIPQLLKPNPSKQEEPKSTPAKKNANNTLTTNTPVMIPSPLNNPAYYAVQSAFTIYHALFLQKQQCAAKNTETVRNVAIRQHNTSYYLTSQQFYLSFKKGNPSEAQLFTAIRNTDCSWSLMSREGLYISLKTAYNYLMLEPTIYPTQKFIFKQKNDYLYIQSAASTLYHWTAINGIGRLAQKQGSRFVIQKWPEV